VIEIIFQMESNNHKVIALSVAFVAQISSKRPCWTVKRILLESWWWVEQISFRTFTFKIICVRKREKSFQTIRAIWESTSISMCSRHRMVQDDTKLVPAMKWSSLETGSMKAMGVSE